MQIGSIVECINDANWPEEPKISEKYPEQGKIYTVREFQISIFTGNIGIRLAEIINPELYLFNGGERSFRIERFRELLPPIDLEESLKKEDLQTV